MYVVGWGVEGWPWISLVALTLTDYRVFCLKLISSTKTLHFRLMFKKTKYVFKSILFFVTPKWGQLKCFKIQAFEITKLQMEHPVQLQLIIKSMFAKWRPFSLFIASHFFNLVVQMMPQRTLIYSVHFLLCYLI